MAYTRAQVKTALGKAREAGKATEGLSVGLRETELQLESWGYLPLPGSRDIEDRVADWYKSQGLAIADNGKPSEPAATTSAASEAALAAAEAALGAASAALALARTMSPNHPPPPERRSRGLGET
jgi:hypothetical protein